MPTKYYDSCVFGNATNEEHPDYDGCCFVTDVANVSWEIAASREITLAELPSVTDFFERFEAYCATSGVVFKVVSLAEAKSQGKLYRTHKRPLEQFGFSGNDWNHLLASLYSSSAQIVTTDEDFFDPENKRNPGSRKKSRRVADYIERNLLVEIIRPIPK